MFLLTARCAVAPATLDDVLGPAVLDALGNPRVMALIDERIGEDTPFISTAEGEVLKVFEKAGYLLVDPGQAKLLKDIDYEALRQSGSPEQLRDLARTFKADVLISGKAYAIRQSGGKKAGVTLHGVKGTVQLRAVLSNSAYMLGSEAVEANDVGTTVEQGAIRAFQKSAPQAAKSLIYKTAYALISGSTGGIPGRTVSVKVAEIDFRNARALQDTLKGTDGVSGVYQRGYRQKVLEIDIVSEKTAEELADLLADNEIDIEDITSSTVEGRFLK